MNLSKNSSNNLWAQFFLKCYLKNFLIGAIFSLSINFAAMAQTEPVSPPVSAPNSSQNITGRWQVKFPNAETSPEIELVIRADGRVFYTDKTKNEAIEIFQLLEKISDQGTFPENIKIIDIQAQAKAEAIERQARRLLTEARTVLATIFLAENEYFTKNSQFSSKLEELGFGNEISSEIFDYKITAIEPKFIVQIEAIPKNSEKDTEKNTAINTAKNPNIAFVGIVYLAQAPKGEAMIASLVCRGEAQPLISKARFIKIGNFVQEIKCPVGFMPVSK